MKLQAAGNCVMRKLVKKKRVKLSKMGFVPKW